MDATGPRSLRDPDALAERRALWQAPALATLRDYVGDLSIRGRDAPAFDPTDAGTDARVLFVLEAPGPKAATGKGSGFISADNNDQTGEAVGKHCDACGEWLETGREWCPSCGMAR